MSTGVIDPPSPSSRSSVLYALGKLEALVDTHKETIQAIPVQVVALLQPQITAIVTDVDALKRWKSTMEQRYWVLLGGGLVVMFFLNKGMPVILSLIQT